MDSTKKRKMELILTAEKTLREKKVALFILTYNAEHQIRKTLKRIPEVLRSGFSEIYIIDDDSIDRTLEAIALAQKELKFPNIKIFRTPYNQGYGGNQKLGYSYAIRRNFDYVIMLHGDGQYPPEELPTIISRLKGDPDAVFGSRMMHKAQALIGGMPLYKWIGNQVLTFLENVLLGTNLTEFHSGYRSYRVPLLREIPFLNNSNSFHFDTDIIVQLVSQKKTIEEISMPTCYGDETCHVNGVSYAWNCILSCVKYRIKNVMQAKRADKNGRISLRIRKEKNNEKKLDDFEEVYSLTMNSMTAPRDSESTSDV